MATSTTDYTPSAIETETIRRVGWRFIPVLLIAYVIAYLDRVNVGFAALSANKDLGLSPTVYGWGAGIFFVGYFIFEYPSNIILERVGARRWIARIMVTWGLVSAAMGLVAGPWSFSAVRFLLGVAEAGFFPGIILYLTYWFPRRYRARFIGLFMAGAVLAPMLGSPISGLLLNLDGIWGVKGWQWLYVLEALPAILLGIFVLFWLTDRPEQAHWLSDAQRNWLLNALARDEAGQTAASHGGFFKALTDKRVLFYALVFFNVTAPSYGMTLWLPQIIKGFGLTSTQVGFLTAVPYIFGVIAMVAWGRHSDRHQERKWHIACCAFLVAISMYACAMTTSPTLQMVAFCVASVGLFGIKGPWLSLVTERFTGLSAAGGIAMVSALGNLSGFLPPYIVGWIKDMTGGFSGGLIFLGTLSVLGGLQVLTNERFEGRMKASDVTATATAD